MLISYNNSIILTLAVSSTALDIAVVTPTAFYTRWYVTSLRYVPVSDNPVRGVWNIPFPDNLVCGVVEVWAVLKITILFTLHCPVLCQWEKLQCVCLWKYFNQINHSTWDGILLNIKHNLPCWNMLLDAVQNLLQWNFMNKLWILRSSFLTNVSSFTIERYFKML